MGNVSGKAYGLTALTRSHPLKTLGVRGVFAAITVALMPPARRSAIAVSVIGSLLLLVAVGLVRLAVPWSPAAMVGGWVGLAGWPGSIAGAVLIVAALALFGGVVGSFWQPRWTLLGRITQIQTNLTDLSFIHYARWVIIKRDEFPRLAKTQPKESLHYDYMLFESNFNGDWEKYIDAFSQVVPGGMDNIWRWSVRYPMSKPITPFLDYIRNCQYDTDHYYSAYPGAATNDIRGALGLEKAIAELMGETANSSAEEFAVRYAHFTVAVQNFLATTGSPPYPMPPEYTRGVAVLAGIGRSAFPAASTSPS